MSSAASLVGTAGNAGRLGLSTASAEVSLARTGNARMKLVSLGASLMGNVGGKNSIVGVGSIVGRHRWQ